MPVPTGRIALLMLTLAAAARPMVHPRLSALQNRDTTCLVWVIFTDKPPAPPGGMSGLSRAALKRRARVGFAARAAEDAPVSREYLARVVGAGGTLRHTFRWANAASFSLPSSRIAAVASLPHVRHLVPVARFRRRAVTPTTPKRRQAPSPRDYGPSYRQFDMMNVPLAHEYVVCHRGETPGDSVVIALFDSGFWLEHRCLQHLGDNAIVADSDFVAHDSDPTFEVIQHGASVMSVIAAYDRGDLIGSAWNARFVLARTEDGGSEHHVEEDNYLAALVWAEALGVDIVSSSLGYRYDFDDPDEDYSYEDMDGRTTVVAKATLGAIERGVIMVSSMGNDGSRGMGSINSPADSPDVIAVGAVDANLRIAGFSSLGPTADGRIKPDLVAMGVDAVVMDGDGSGYTRTSGTSFSAPHVAGVVALIRQCRPSLSAAGVRERLLRSCRFTPFQDTVDNTYGRGVPDALAACLPDNAVFIMARDTLGNRVGYVQARALPDGAPIRADTGGTVLLRLDSLPAMVRVLVPGGDTMEAAVDSLPSYRTLMFSIRRELVVAVVSLDGSPVSGASVYMGPVGAAVLRRRTTDRRGLAVGVYHTEEPVCVAVSAPGYGMSDTITVDGGGLRCTTTVTLRPRLESRFAVFPNVIRRLRGARELSVEFVHDYNSSARPFTVSVRTVGGTLVWRDQGITPVDGPLRLRFDCRNASGRPLGPGTYFLVLECAGERQVRKFIVVG